MIDWLIDGLMIKFQKPSKCSYNFVLNFLADETLPPYMVCKRSDLKTRLKGDLSIFFYSQIQNDKSEN